MANQKSSQDKQQYFIPFEVTTSTIIPDEYKDQPLKCLQIGMRKFQGLLIPVSKKVYQEYMRPEWKDDKRKQRQAENRRKREKAQETGTKDKTIKPWDTAVSYERLREKGFEFGAGYEIEDVFSRKNSLRSCVNFWRRSKKWIASSCKWSQKAIQKQRLLRLLDCRKKASTNANTRF